MKTTSLVLIASLFCLAGCAKPVPAVMPRLNDNAALSGNLPANPLRWQVITSAIDHRNSSMYTMFGNEDAVTYARSHNDQNYPPGSILSLVTWKQTEDPRWFGGMTPDKAQSVEFVEVKADASQGRSYSYERYAGAPLTKVSSETSAEPNERAAYVLSQRAAVMP
jgi:Cytochrome P460